MIYHKLVILYFEERRKCQQFFDAKLKSKYMHTFFELKCNLNDVFNFGNAHKYAKSLLAMKNFNDISKTYAQTITQGKLLILRET